MGNEDQILTAVLSLVGDMGTVLDRTATAAAERQELFALMRDVREHGCVVGSDNAKRIERVERNGTCAGPHKRQVKEVEFLGWKFSGYRLADVTRAIIALLIVVSVSLIMLRVHGLNAEVSMLAKRIMGTSPSTVRATP